ncbi:MAG: flagellar hook-basal body complex protein FliE [Sulfurospirillum sp.]
MQNSVKGISSLINSTNTNKTTTQNSKDFSKVLESSISEVNGLQENAQKAMSDMATGEVKDLHQAAIAIDKAELSMKMMLEVRNKALNAYKEISRTQI